MPDRRESMSARAAKKVRRMFASALGVALVWTASAAPTFNPAVDFTAGCINAAPWYVAACNRMIATAGGRPSLAAPAVMLFQDTPSNTPHYVLATHAQVGSVWGMAYRSGEPAVYAAAYQKRSVFFGPSGPGAIYRVDLATGDVTTFAVVPETDADSHDDELEPLAAVDHDLEGARWVGRRSLGDLDISDDEQTLFVVNLTNGRIYRYGLPGGNLLGSFAHGAARETWTATAQPFALAYHSGALYHGVVDSRTGRAARVYRSAADGTNMVEVARLDLSYERGRLRLQSGTWTLRWQRWERLGDPMAAGVPLSRDSMALFTDIEFTASGDMAIALRDRRSDQTPPEIDGKVFIGLPPRDGFDHIVTEENLGFGDIFLVRRDGERFTAPPGGFFDEYYDDSNALFHPESALGGLARAPGLGIVAGAYGIERARDRVAGAWEGVYGYERDGRNRVSHEIVCRPGDFVPYEELLHPAAARVHADNEMLIGVVQQVGTVGDIEDLCPAVLPTPTATSSSTPTPTGTLTATPIPSATSTATATPSPSPTLPPPPIYLPLTLKEACDPSRVRADVVLVLDASSSMNGEKFEAAKASAKAFVRAMHLPDNQVGIVAFNRIATVASPLSRDASTLETAIDAIVTSPGTRIDTGLEAASDLIAGPDRDPANVAVIVLMTDGIQEDQAQRPLDLAAQLIAAGVELYVIGLGADVDAGYLLGVAGAPDRLYLSPSPDKLVGIYEEIARVIPCPAAGFWGGR
jgi:uncharacterized protein YegL